MKFNVAVQGVFYKTITAANTGAALAAVSADIAAGLVPITPNTPHAIVLTAQPAEPFDQWESVAPQSPKRFDVWLAPDQTEWIYDQPRGANGRYVSDDPSTPEKESAMRWQPHTIFNVSAAE